MLKRPELEKHKRPWKAIMMMKRLKDLQLDSKRPVSSRQLLHFLTLNCTLSFLNQSTFQFLNFDPNVVMLQKLVKDHDMKSLQWNHYKLISSITIYLFFWQIYYNVFVLKTIVILNKKVKFKIVPDHIVRGKMMKISMR